MGFEICRTSKELRNSLQCIFLSILIFNSVLVYAQLSSEPTLQASAIVIYDDNSHSTLSVDQFKYDFVKSNNRLLQFIYSDTKFVNKVKIILEKEILRGNT